MDFVWRVVLLSEESTPLFPGPSGLVALGRCCALGTEAPRPCPTPQVDLTLGLMLDLTRRFHSGFLK